MKEPLVITVPNKKLKEVTGLVTSFVLHSNDLKLQINQMIKILRKKGGIGLAANQLGYSNQVIIIEYKDLDKKNHIPLEVFINPKIVEYSKDKESLEEGCLSVPKIELEVERSSKIKVKYQNDKGKKIKIAPKGLLARILQHEIDHLGGVIFTERVKEQLLAKFSELRNLKIAFFGSGQFGAIILEGLILLGFNLHIYTEKAKPAGRNRESKLTAVAEVAKKFGKEYFEITSLGREPSALKVNRGARAHGQSEDERLVPNFLAGEIVGLVSLSGTGERPFDLLICADFGQKIPENILNQTKITALNIHPSLLPKYVGPTPIQTAILNNDKTTGVSIIKITEKIDQGPIYAQIETEILNKDTYPVLRDRLATLGLKLLVKILPKMVRDELELIPQDLSKTTRTRKYTKADGEIDWSKSAVKIEAQIRAFYPWPGTYSFINDKRLIIHSAHLIPSKLKTHPSKLSLDIVQVEGKKPMKFGEFLRGFKGPKPKWFEKIKI